MQKRSSRATPRKKSARLTTTAEPKIVRRAKTTLKRGKQAAGELVREVIADGKHGVRSVKQAVAAGLSKARRAGVPLPAPKRGKASARTRTATVRDIASAPKRKAPSRKRTSLATKAPKRGTVTKLPLSTQAKRAAAKRRGRKSVAKRSASKRTTAKKTTRK